MGQKLGSLSMLNLVSVASTQPLDKVMGLIKGMIEKLEKEAAEAASIHEFCNAEKKKNEEATKKATDKKDDLQAFMSSAMQRKRKMRRQPRRPQTRKMTCNQPSTRLQPKKTSLGMKSLSSPRR